MTAPTSGPIRPASADRPARRPRRRGRTLVIVLVILVGVLVAADFGLAAAAEYQVAQRMRTQLQLSDDPSVRINGFPFTTQALSGDYRDIEIKANGVSVQELHDVEVQANLYHVRIPLSDLLAGDVSAGKIDEVKGRVKIQASDIARMINEKLPITDFTIGPDDRPAPTTETPETPAPPVDNSTATIKLTATVSFAGRQDKLTAYATVSLRDGGLKIIPAEIEFGDTSLGALPQFQQLASDALKFEDLYPGVLPFDITPTAIKAESGALVVEGTLTNVPLDGGSTR
ncbi:LmeA family phospholipid-binding protein [Goodfellowiella coeruleoviolacea]|uniref:DUF2993 domain-containing protein n=1 Tax=Goodfellowiella coeruleoviolacea TaxID=334858 RepID=A0AAE3KGN7_9PSEU|nr:DUF2993 domain-containing protein [Goodfellowiella coeruleoviolacea]MCP2166102.1 Protein of unknown function (DUF2993) [Goodfellowiella coeruleoviolacea]